jgi:SAM-dependent methyltransferase
MPVVRAIGYAERAAFYETEYATTADHAFLRALVTSDVCTILEVPAGVGRNLEWLADSGRAVVMADLEPAMIARLRERIAERGAAACVTALMADMRYLSLPQRFDLLIVPQGGLQLLPGPEDALRALTSLHRHMSDSGRLVLDLTTFEAGIDGDDDARSSYFDPIVPNGQFVHEWTRPLPDGRSLTRCRTQHLERDTLTTTFFYQIEAPDGSVEESSFVMGSRRYQYEQVALLADTVGLRVERVCRNYRGDPYLGSGHRMIFVLTVA